MNILKSDSKPKKKTFTLKSTKNGDNIDHLDFLLENKIDTTTYAVQAGSFHNMDLAIHALKKVNRKESPQFYVRFVKKDSLFRITTNCFKHRSAADSMLKIIKKDYPDAIERKCSTLAPKLKFRIQIGAYNSKANADKYIQVAQSKITQPIQIEHDTNSGLYKLKLPIVNNWIIAFKEMEKLRKLGFNDVFIGTIPEISWLNKDFIFKVQVAVYNNDNIKSAEYYQKRIKKKYKYPTIIYKNNEKGICRLLLKNNYTWQKAQRIWNQLEKEYKLNDITVIMIRNKKN
jgi:hypothetical protein